MRFSHICTVVRATFKYQQAPQSLLLDIDDTADEVHGAQQQSLFNGYYDHYCYLPLHIYEGQSGKLITSILRPGRRPTGQEIVSILKRVVRAIRREWPEVLILLRGDGHFSVPEVHEWCESQEPKIFYILGQSGNKVVKDKARGILQQAQLLYRFRQERYLRKRRQEEHKHTKSKSKETSSLPEQPEHDMLTEQMKVKLYTEFLYQAETWSEPRRIICKVEVSEKGENLRFIVTNLQHSRKAYIYETIYCGRGQMENYIKDHKRFLHSDRLSCHKFEANQFRLFLHSAAYVLMHHLKTKGLQGTAWSRAQFDQIQLRVLKVGARVEENELPRSLLRGSSFRYRHTLLALQSLCPFPPTWGMVSFESDIVNKRSEGIHHVPSHRSRTCVLRTIMMAPSRSV